MKIGNTLYLAVDWYDEDEQGNVIAEGTTIISGNNDEEMYDAWQKAMTNHSGCGVRPAFDTEVQGMKQVFVVTENDGKLFLGSYLAESKEAVEQELLRCFENTLDGIEVRLATEEEAQQYYSNPDEWYEI